MTYIEHDWKHANGDSASIVNYIVGDITRGQFTLGTAARTAADRKLIGMPDGKTVGMQ